MRYKLKDTVFPQNTSSVFCDVDNATLPFTKFQSKVKIITWQTMLQYTCHVIIFNKIEDK